MGKMNFVSSLAVINQFASNYNPVGDGWVGKAVEDIGSALNIMHMHPTMQETVCELTIVNYRAKLPCGVEAITWAEYNGCNFPIIGKYKVPGDSALDLRTVPHGTYNGPYLRTSFETGTVKIHYYTLPLDEQGWPLIPDNQKLFEALQWFLLMRYISRGGVHPSFNFDTVEARWRRDYPAAQNSVNFPSTQETERFSQMWVNIIPDLDFHYVAYKQTVRADRFNGDISEFTEPSINNNI